MSNNMYMQEKFLEQTQREQSHTIENNTLIAQSKEHKRHTQGLIGQCGSLLIALGRRLEQVEQQHLHSHSQA